ncbi:hypothetical protein [Laspinema palackyanum]|uniref:hypothetical protein n=1 Tax=Laspinema palackyanum TaxID=3231601 RepID=UPI00345CBF64|nr:hypothetical protein [Laspinema sp. D2c]
MPNYMPSRAAKTVNNFLQVLAHLKPDAALNAELQSNLPELEQILTQTADNPLELAICIKEWCKRHHFDLPSLKTRLEIGEDDDTDNSLEGDNPDCVINKDVIIKAIKTTQSDEQPQ